MKKLLPKTANNPQGFTLVELLVVISIIAILAVIGVATFTTVQKSGRDSRRKGDIDAIAKAYEIAYAGGSITPYRVLTTADFASGQVPVDPQSGASYTGHLTAAAATYTVCATLENPTGNATSTVGAGLGTVTNGGYYCRKAAQ